MPNTSAASIQKLSIDDAAELHATILENIYNIFDEKTPNTKFNTDQLMLTLFARILCGADSIATLSKSKLYTYIPVILRSMLEARVDLINLSKNKDYIRRMAFAFFKQEDLFLSEAIKNKSLAAHFKEGGAFLTRLNNAKSYMEDNKSANIRKISKKFKKAGLFADYCTTYNELCRSTHNNVDKLLSDHFKQDCSWFVVHAIPDISTFTFYMFISANICLHSAILVSSLFNVSPDSFVKAKESYLKIQQNTSH